MATITKSITAAYGPAPHLIPQDTLRAIDQGELLDRLVASREAVQKSQASMDPQTRRGYAALARAILTAQPRARTERETATLVAKAAASPPSQAAALRADAAKLLERHPPAPRRAEAVTKAAEEPDMMAVFDQDGTLLGIVPRAKVQPVTTGRAREPVGKARRRSPGRR